MHCNSTGRILVVDDGRDQAYLFEKILTGIGYIVRTESNGIDALASLEEFRPDIILLDIGLPDMDGYELARRIRCWPGFGSTAIVAITGYGEDKELAREAGIDRHLLKPVGVAQISMLIAGLLAEPSG
jgi:CheY-like chemotaxis protein